MLEKEGYIWKSNADVICIPTNSHINMMGELIMERGVALEVTEFNSNISFYFARHVESHGNTPCFFRTGINPNFCSLPIKDRCRDNPELSLIKRSIERMVAIMNTEKRNFLTIALPRPGCEHGELDWENVVKPIIEPLLDDRFIIYSMRR